MKATITSITHTDTRATLMVEVDLPVSEEGREEALGKLENGNIEFEYKE